MKENKNSTTVNEKIIIAQTFTSLYNEIEDRILLALNYKDIDKRVDFWLTRAYIIKLMPVFCDFVDKNEYYKNLNQTSSQDERNNLAIKNGKNSKEKGHNLDVEKNDQTDFALFRLTQKKPILLESVDFICEKDGFMKIVFKNKSENITCVSRLSKSNFKHLYEMIQKSIPKFLWGIGSF